MINSVGIAIVGALSGFLVARHHEMGYLVIAFALAVGQAASRPQIFVATWAYLAGASWSLPIAFLNFFPDSSPLFAWIVWLAYGIPGALTFAYGMAASPNAPAGMIARGVAVLCVAAIPPIGGTFAAHPWFAAGDLFPGTGLTGLLATSLLFAAFAASGLEVIWTKSEGKLRCFAVGAGLLIVAAAVRLQAETIGTVPRAPEVVAIDTYFGKPPENAFAEYALLAPIAADIRKSARPTTNGEPLVVVLPEATSQPTSPARLRWWRNELREYFAGGGVLVLGEASVSEGKSFAVISNTTYDWAAARQSTPIAEWRPGRANGHQAFGWWRSGLRTVAGDIDIIQCYEALVPWTLLVSAWTRPSIVVLQSNQWWAGTSDGSRVLAEHFLARAKLLGVSSAASINHPAH
ncbi:MAG: hypothetical protein ABL985_05925 [Casimicrobium sp.]